MAIHRVQYLDVVEYWAWRTQTPATVGPIFSIDPTGLQPRATDDSSCPRGSWCTVLLLIGKRQGITCHTQHVPGCAYPCALVPRYPCTWSRIGTLLWPLPELSDQGTNKEGRFLVLRLASLACLRTSADRALLNDSTALRSQNNKAKSTTMHPLVPDQVESSRVESSYWRSSTQSPAAHRADKSNSISTVTNYLQVARHVTVRVSRLSTAHLTVQGHATAPWMPTRAASHCL